MNQTDLPDPVKEDIAELRQANARMEERVLELERELGRLRQGEVQGSGGLKT